MTEFRSDRDNMLNVVERRDAGGRFEYRKDKSTGQIILEGYAATFDPYDCHGEPNSGGWIEQLSKRGMDSAVAEQPDLQLLINHGGTPLARTTSGTLKLSVDGHGLRVWAALDPEDPDVKALVPKMKRQANGRANMDEMSFAFRVTDQTWNTSYSHRTINSLSLEKGDVSIVNYGMNPGTKALIADAVQQLSQLSSKELVELRSKMNLGQAKRAVAALQAIAGSDVVGLGSTFVQGLAQGLVQRDGDFADPGYQSDGKKRYPLSDEDKVRAAWSYINMPRNSKKYTSVQLSSIKGKIKAAAKRYGIQIADDAGKTGLSKTGQEPRVNNVTSLLDSISSLLKREGGFSPDSDHWNPGAVQSEDPHESPYEVGDMGLVGAGPIPGNIMGGGDRFVGAHDEFKTPSPEGDPHDQSLDTEEHLSMDPHAGSLEFGPYPGGSKITPLFGASAGESGGDPHDQPYAVGGQVGNVPGDRPGTGPDKGKVPDNIVAQGSRGPGDNVPANAVTGAPSVGTEPVTDPGHQAFDWSNGTLEPGDPAQELDLDLRSDDPHDGPTMGGAGSSYRPGGWEPTNIEGGAVHHDDDEDSDDDATDRCDGEMMSLGIDFGMVQALDRTIVDCFNLRTASPEVRQLLKTAQKQFAYLIRPAVEAKRGNKAARKASDLDQKLAELRSEVGAPDTGTVADGLKFIRSEGAAPVGYGGLLDRDPDMHLRSGAERVAKVAKEAVEADRRARTAATESNKANERRKAAEREAQLNDAIRRHHLQKG